MSKLSGKSIVLLALIAGLVAATLTALFLQRERAQAASRSKPVSVVVATQDIPARTVIQPGMVRETMLAAATVPYNAVAKIPEVMGQVTLAALKADQPIARAKVAAPNASLGLAYVVPEGMRAVTVALDPIIGVAGFLKAGDHVDVLATFEVEKINVTKTVLQDVQLLAIGPNIVPGETAQPNANRNARPADVPNATLALNPDDAETLILAESKGKLRLTLRPMGDAVRVALSGIRSDTLIGVRPAAARDAAAPRPSARIVSVGYSSPAFVAPPARRAETLSDFRPQPITLGATAKPATDLAASANSVETIRGTQKTTVDVRSE